MAKLDTIQASFVGGELGPSLMGRTDIAQYANAAAIVQNWIIRPFGSLISTPGLQFINQCVTGGSTTLSGARLIPFQFSVTDSFIIEMGVGYFRFYTNGAVVVSTGTTPYQVSHNYAGVDIPNIQFCQDNDVLYLFHGNYPPATLTRFSSTNWVLSNLGFTGGPFMPQNSTKVTLLADNATAGANANITVVVPTWATGNIYNPGDYIISGSTLYVCQIQNNGGGQSTTLTLPGTVANDNANSAGNPWTLVSPYSFNPSNAGVFTSEYLKFTNWGFTLPTNATISGISVNVTQQAQSNTVDSSVKLAKAGTLGGTDHSVGNGWVTSPTTAIYGNQSDLWGESLTASDINASGFGVGFAVTAAQYGNARISYVSITVYTSTSSFASDLANGYWKAASSIFQSGHVGSYWSIGSTVTSATTGLAVQGYVKITTVASALAATGSVISMLSTTGATTLWAEGSWSSVRGYPSKCAFFQSRLFAARTKSEPQTIWASGSFSFTNFAVNGGADDDALNLQLAATQSNDIKWLAPMNDLIVGTYGGEFIVTAGVGTGNPLTPASASVIQQTSWGSEPIVPKRIGNFTYYIQRGAQKLREIFYEWTNANYKSVDRTILSPHINGGGFVDMTYQQNPDTVLWMVCSNGTIATMTREVDQQVQGWTRQVTQGKFLSIASIPSQSGPYDEVWVIVQRTINGSTVNYIERFASQLITMQGSGSLIPQQDQLFYVHSGLTYDAFAATLPSTVSISLSATAGTIVVTSSAAYFAAGNVGKRLRAVDQYHNMLGEILITGYTSSTIVVGTSKQNFTVPSYSAGYWGVSVTSVSGLSYLEAATVIVLADGGTDYPSKVVSNGTISLQYNYFVVTVGLSAPQIFVSLPQEPPNEKGTSQGKKQRINALAFKLNNSYTGFSVGGTTGTLYPIYYPRIVTSMGTEPILVTGVIPNISFKDASQGGYQYGAQVQIYNSDPLPIELLSLITSIETFNKD